MLLRQGSLGCFCSAAAGSTHHMLAAIITATIAALILALPPRLRNHPDNPTTTDWDTPQRDSAESRLEMWLGPAAWRPYHPRFHPANFRWFMDLGGGQIRDRGNHAISIACWLMNHDLYRGTVTVEATGKPQVEGIYDVPKDFQSGGSSAIQNGCLHGRRSPRFQRPTLPGARLIMVTRTASS